MLSPDHPPRPRKSPRLRAMSRPCPRWSRHFWTLPATLGAGRPAPAGAGAGFRARHRGRCAARRAGRRLHPGPPDGLANGEGLATFRPDSLRRAIENLIGNAVRYGEHAEVEAALGPGWFRVSVEDDGRAFRPTGVPRRSSPLPQLDPARNQNRGQGVGLGLSIAAEVARAHGGQLRLGDGRGWAVCGPRSSFRAEPDPARDHARGCGAARRGLIL